MFLSLHVWCVVYSIFAINYISQIDRLLSELVSYYEGRAAHVIILRQGSIYAIIVHLCTTATGVVRSHFIVLLLHASQ